MSKYFSLVLSFILALGASAQLSLDTIQSLIQREVTNKRSQSIVVGIIDANGRKILSAGRISPENPRPPDANTIYEIGSITKVFTALVLADMAVKKDLSLDDPISKFLSDTLHNPKRNGKEITLLDLSAHTSGFPRNAWNICPRDPDNPFADYDVPQLLQFVSGFELQRDIGSRWAYSNIAYTLLGYVLTTHADKDYQALIDERICNRLKMHSTTLSVKGKTKKNCALSCDDCGKPATQWDFPLPGGGGLRSNTNDLLTFAAANVGLIKTDLLGAMELCHQERIKKESMEHHMAIGWTRWQDDGREILYKDGGTGGTRTFLGFDKKRKVGLVILSTSNNSITDLALHILDTTYKFKSRPYQWQLVDTLRETIFTRGIDAAIEQYAALKVSGDERYRFNEQALNQLGLELRRQNKIKEAIRIFELNAKEYPNSAMVFESLAETYMRTNDPKSAAIYFSKAKASEPDNPHWEFMLGKVKGF